MSRSIVMDSHGIENSSEPSSTQLPSPKHVRDSSDQRPALSSQGRLISQLGRVLDFPPKRHQYLRTRRSVPNSRIETRCESREAHHARLFGEPTNIRIEVSQDALRSAEPERPTASHGQTTTHGSIDRQD